MTKTELLEIIANGENSGVEFKRDIERPRQLAKELVAFCNLQGGVVLLGVEDTGDVVGLTRVDDEESDNRTYRKLEEWVMQACRDKIRPEVIPYFEIVRNVMDDKDVAVVQVEPGWSVHSVWHEQRRTYYIRVGTLSREASPEELERLFQQRGSVRAELRPISGAGVDDLDIDRLLHYFGEIRQQETPDRKDREGWEVLLENTELLTSEGGKCTATMAGLLLFGLTPRRFLPHATIDAAAYNGDDKEYAANERTTLHGALTARFDADGNVQSRGLVEQAVDFVARNTRASAELVDGSRRAELPEYPPEVIREAIVNAVVHRDYLLSGTDIELSVYTNRIEVVSPGRLPNGITPERMRSGTRAARNQLLKDVMRDYGYLEHMGMGVPRKIVKLMNEEVGTDPELVEEDERFIVRLFSAPVAQA